MDGALGETWGTGTGKSNRRSFACADRKGTIRSAQDDTFWGVIEEQKRPTS